MRMHMHMHMHTTRYITLTRKLARSLAEALRASVQEEGPLGQLLQEEWEWDAVMEQVEDFGWTWLDVR
jgi:hypothetical protein